MGISRRKNRAPGNTGSMRRQRNKRRASGNCASRTFFLGIAVYAYPDFVLELYVFVLTPLLVSEPVLIEHSAGAWRTALELSKLPWDECDSLFVPLLKDYHPF